MGNINSCWEPAETSSRCATPTATAAHNFEVDNYSRLKGMGAGEFVSSRSFWVGGHKWKIRFYPDGAHNEAAGAGYAAAYLRLCSAPPAGTGVHTTFTLSLLQAKDDGKVHGGGSHRSSSTLHHTFRSGGNICSGFVDFIEKSKLRQDCFTIRCDLTVVKKPSVRAGAWRTLKMC